LGREEFFSAERRSLGQREFHYGGEKFFRAEGISLEQRISLGQRHIL
jgi:hypothetical protein